MIVFESRRTRRIIGRLERGEQVIRALEQVAREREISTGWVRAVGHLEWVELRRYDARARRWSAPERIEAPSEVVALEGSLSFQDGETRARLQATLRRESPGGMILFGGEIVDAGVFALEVVVECFDDLGLRRERDADTGLPLWSGISVPVSEVRPGETAEPGWSGPAAPPEPPMERRGDDRPPAPGGISWAQVAEASAAPPPRPEPVQESRGWGREREQPRPRRRKPAHLTEAREPAPVPEPLPEKRKISEEEFFEEPIPEQGDWVDHRTFGLCRVEGDDAEGGIIIRLPSGVRKHINLDVLEVQPARIEGDRIVYPVRPRRR